ncbi:MAG: tRNA preQ1(34) S-adenosylmethionine ribosyltransferase-isomerase QueA [Lysobacter sp.]|nr:tRNA preQ1(34) S-adenosylmethionine ribosyltransferase-isomerase QueA [Lysobacter sp.]
MKKSDFHYELPPELIAQAPLAERSASRLLQVPRAPAAFEDRAFGELPQLLAPGDLLVFNDTRVIPARLFGHKSSGGRVEILIERLLAGGRARAQLGVSKSPKAGARIALDAGGEAEVLGREGEFYLLQFHLHDQPHGDSLESWLLHAGRLPLPPYIQREPGRDDDERYQTVFAREVGAVAAPTAGLHFDEALLQRLRERGIEFGHVTLHVGAGTFQPVRVDSLDQHVMHSEWLNVGAGLVEQVRRTRAAGGRVIAVGTTVVRALESAMRNGELQPYAGETRLFILPGYRIRSVDAMVTNFHLPESTLLMMVSAFAGQQRVFDAYAHAIAQRYRFFSYGDAMLLWPQA